MRNPFRDFNSSTEVICLKDADGGHDRRTYVNYPTELPSAMETQKQAYGDLIRLAPGNDPSMETLQRIPPGTSVANGGMGESSLRDLLFRFPRTLPISAIDAAYAGAVPVCRELSTPAGYVDALYVNPLGRLTLAEFKLWRNPQSRREVIGQILDYTQEIASWNYEDLQREVSKALKRKGNVLHELIRENAPGVHEAEFVDNVTRHLKRGEFLLLIIGDGIREGVENIVNFVQRHSGLHFNLALVEAALYRDKANRVILQPRILMRTEIVSRIVVEEGAAREAITDDDDEEDDVLSNYQQENRRFWTAVLDDYSFSDMTVEVPAAGKESTLYVKVEEFGIWRLGIVLCRIHLSQFLSHWLLFIVSQGHTSSGSHPCGDQGIVRGTTAGVGR